ncbi:MAG: rRNA maturation RNase YbeY [Magnetococcales bacterium]|nr:rRNA maturation RNase YbeY [Magnetococcales bacterium]
MPAPRLRVTRDHPGWTPQLVKVIRQAVVATLAHTGVSGGKQTPEVSLLLTGDAAIQEMNRTWRGIDKPTNVLSFALEDEFTVAHPPRVRPLGDVVLAFETLLREATAYDVPLQDHLAHMVVHGVLHLLGHDHEKSAAAAERQEQEERAVLKSHLFKNLPCVHLL